MSTRLGARIERLQHVMQPVGRTLAMRVDPSQGLAERPDLKNCLRALL
jgi:hypothetical protein